MVIDYLSNDFYALTNPGGNYTQSAAYPSRVPTVTQPNLIPVTTGIQAVGDGVIPMGQSLSGPGNYAPGHLMIIPIGVGAAGTFSMQVLGWRATQLAKAGPFVPNLWVPILLGTYAVTLGTATGVAGSDLGATTLFATTITMTGGPTFVTSGAAPVSLDWLQISPTGNPIGMVCVTSFGFRFMETIFNNTTSTSCNALYCKF